MREKFGSAKDLLEVQKNSAIHLGPQGLNERCCAWVRECVPGQFLKPEEGSYGHISEAFILAEFYLLRVSIQNLGE